MEIQDRVARKFEALLPAATKKEIEVGRDYMTMTWEIPIGKLTGMVMTIDSFIDRVRGFREDIEKEIKKVRLDKVASDFNIYIDDKEVSAELIVRNRTQPEINEWSQEVIDDLGFKKV